MQRRRLARTAGAALTLVGMVASVLAVSTATAGAATTLVVTTAAASGPGSLRATIPLADDGDTIAFDLPPSSIITLTGSSLIVAADITIDGSTAEDLTIDGDGLSRVFDLRPVGVIRVQGLSIRGGAAEDGAGILAWGGGGEIELHDVNVFGNYAERHGGGIYVASGSLEVTSSTIFWNSAGQQGGGIAADDTSGDLHRVSITDSTIYSNEALDGTGGLHVQRATDEVTITDTSLFLNQMTGEDGSGGAVLHDVGQVDITGSTFSGNTGAGNGGGLLVASTTGGVSIGGDTWFTNNHGALGGGLAIVDSEGIVTVEGATFSGNTADYSGGGFYIRRVDSGDDAATDVSISSTTITENTAAVGGGGAIWGVHGGTSIDGTTITANTATGDPDSMGGGGLVLGDVDAHLSDTTIDGNTASTNGGGIVMTTELAMPPVKSAGFGAKSHAAERGTRLVLERSTVSGNQAVAVGGGVALEEHDHIVVLQSTVSGNSASLWGGGLASASSAGGGLIDDTDPGHMVVRHSTVTANSAPSGGGIVVRSGAVPMEGKSVHSAPTPSWALDLIDHSIVAGNVATDGSHDAAGEMISRHSIIENADGPDVVVYDEGGNIFGLGADLGGLQDNGGTTKTHLPDLTSIAIDAGAPGVDAPATDQRSLPRAVGGAIDIGSVEPQDVVSTDPGGPVPPGTDDAPEDPEEATEEPGEPGTLTCDGTPEGAFSDVAATNVHREAVECLAHLGITEGGPGDLPADHYGASQLITRGQLASLLARLLAVLEIELPPGPNQFTDDEISVHHQAINALAAAGIIDGYADGTFGAGDTVRRDQLASLLHRLHQLITGEALPTGPDAFDDDGGTVAEPNVHEAAINALAAAGVIDGTAIPRTYDPAGPVRRDQMASFLVRLISILDGTDAAAATKRSRTAA